MTKKANYFTKNRIYEIIKIFLIIILIVLAIGCNKSDNQKPDESIYYIFTDDFVKQEIYLIVKMDLIGQEIMLMLMKPQTGQKV
jgi:hypothetical protein